MGDLGGSARLASLLRSNLVSRPKDRTPTHVGANTSLDCNGGNNSGGSGGNTSARLACLLHLRPNLVVSRPPKDTTPTHVGANTSLDCNREMTIEISSW